MFNLYCRETKGCFNPTVRGGAQGRDMGGGEKGVVGLLEGKGEGRG